MPQFGDVAPAGDQYSIVRNQDLVVQSMIEFTQTYEILDVAPQASLPPRIPDADFDVRVRIKGRDFAVTSACEEVIDQHADPNAAIGRLLHTGHEQASAEIRSPQIGLHIKRAVG